MTRLLRTAQEGRLADEIVPSEGGTGPPSAISPGTGAERGHSVREWVRVCFSCGRQGHGVNRCSQVDTSFPFLPQGWSVDVRNGQYRATRTDGTGLWSTPGNEGWSGREGQPPGSSGIKVRLNPAGELVVRVNVGRLGSCWWDVGSDLTGLRAHRLFRHWGAIPGYDKRRLPDRTEVVLGCGSPIVPIPPVGRLIVGGPTGVRSSETWEGDAACRRD